MKKEIKLPNNIVKKLQALPESGMGYQIVNFKLKSGKFLKKITVLNSSIAILEQNITVSEIVEVQLVDD